MLFHIKKSNGACLLNPSFLIASYDFKKILFLKKRLKNCSTISSASSFGTFNFISNDQIIFTKISLISFDAFPNGSRYCFFFCSVVFLSFFLPHKNQTTPQKIFTYLFYYATNSFTSHFQTSFISEISYTDTASPSVHPRNAHQSFSQPDSLYLLLPDRSFWLCIESPPPRIPLHSPS